MEAPQCIFVLRNFGAEQGLHPGDLLVELTSVTFSSSATATFVSQFAVDAQILAAFVGKADTASTVGFKVTWSSGTVTVTGSVSNSETVYVMLIAKPTV